MMLNIFSWANWLFACLLWRKVYWCISLTFWIGLSSHYGVEGVPGGLSQLSIRPLILAQVMISRFMGLSSLLVSARTAQCLLRILSLLLSFPLHHLISLKNKHLKKNLPLSCQSSLYILDTSVIRFVICNFFPPFYGFFFYFLDGGLWSTGILNFDKIWFIFLVLSLVFLVLYLRVLC